MAKIIKKRIFVFKFCYEMSSSSSSGVIKELAGPVDIPQYDNLIITFDMFTYELLLNSSMCKKYNNLDLTLTFFSFFLSFMFN